MDQFQNSAPYIPPTNAATTFPQDNSDMFEYPSSPPKKGGSFMWISSVLIVIGVLVYVYFLFKNNSTTSSTKSVSKVTIPSTPPATPSTTPNVVVSNKRHPRSTLPPSEICRQMSDDFGIRPNNPASAEGVPSILDAWEHNKCHTVPTVWSCQNISDAYNTSPSSNYQNPGYQMYKERGCSSLPSIGCQAISDKYQTRPGYWGDISPELMSDVQGDVLRDAWRNRHCQTVPQNLTCQDLSNIYNITPTSQGIAPPSIYGTYKSKGCRSSPMTCQYISDVYMIGGSGSRFAFTSSQDMNYSDIAWDNQKCSTEAPPVGYVTSLTNRTYSTGNTVYSSNKLIDCLQECITDTSCDLVEYNPVSKECKNKGNVDFNGGIQQNNGIVTYRKRTT